MSIFGKFWRAIAATIVSITLVAGVAEARPGAGTETGKADQGRIRIEIDKKTQRMTVIVDGEQRHVFKVSTGRQGFTTPSGTFRVLLMKEMHYSRKYDNAPMPNSLFFTNNGHAIHATSAVKMLGRVASHGCVRLSPKDAKTLYELVESMGMKRVTIVVM
jgi:lipoprotein-anchoring transpeptidase ErfK/SrfK